MAGVRRRPERTWAAQGCFRPARRAPPSPGSSASPGLRRVLPGLQEGGSGQGTRRGGPAADPPLPHRHAPTQAGLAELTVGSEPSARTRESLCRHRGA